MRKHERLPIVHERESVPITADMASKIKTMLSWGFYQHHIAGIFGINQGRVSEIKTGKRFANVKPD